MCEHVSHVDDESAGEIWAICSRKDRALHLAGDVFGVEIDPKNPTADDEPLRSVLEAFCSRAHTLVVESWYFDIDYRSELSLLQEKSFQWMSQDVSRFHFFETKARGKNNRLRDFVEKAEGYLGYCIVRPYKLGLIGRSMISNRVKLPNGVEPGVAAQRVRATALEEIQLFGVPKSVVGVPFMEQDGRLLRCAHVSAWICHYSATLRGWTTRRPTGHFHNAADTREAIGRPFPSDGLTISSLSAMLRAVDLPPEIIDSDELRVGRESTWADSRWFAGEAAKVRGKPATELTAEDEAFWVRANATAAIGRYLNSSIPVIVANNADEHTYVIVGYLRQSDLGEKIDRSKSPDPIASLVVADDQAGPFSIVSIDEFAKAVLGDNPPALLVPLPRSMWMPSSIAEKLAAEWFKIFVEDRHEALDASAPNSRLAKRFKKLFDGFSGNGAFGIRSYIVRGDEFKESFAERVSDPMAIRLSGQAQFPQYVWVSEVYERSASPDGRVMSGTIVFDPTSQAARPGRPAVRLAEGKPLFVHLPGQIFVPPPSQLSEDAGEEAWSTVKIETYSSGRSGHSMSGRRRGWKQAVSGA